MVSMKSRVAASGVNTGGDLIAPGTVCFASAPTLIHSFISFPHAAPNLRRRVLSIRPKEEDHTKPAAQSEILRLIFHGHTKQHIYDLGLTT